MRLACEKELDKHNLFSGMRLATARTVPREGGVRGADDIIWDTIHSIVSLSYF